MESCCGITVDVRVICIRLLPFLLRFFGLCVFCSCILDIVSSRNGRHAKEIEGSAAGDTQSATTFKKAGQTRRDGEAMQKFSDEGGRGNLQDGPRFYDRGTVVLAHARKYA